ncbi:MAG: hypothetical protein J6V44_11585 [Methanobrevibacter sp.]|nr:hypothetical protein [Methanobrevibacter sp.]
MDFELNTLAPVKRAIKILVLVNILFHAVFILYKQIDAMVFIHKYAKQENIESLNFKITKHAILKESRSLSFYASRTIANLPKIDVPEANTH